jgi:hypothetical protein
MAEPKIESEFKMIDAKSAREQLEQNLKEYNESFAQKNKERIDLFLKSVESNILKGIENHNLADYFSYIFPKKI